MVTIDLKDLAGKKVAVDVSIFLNKFVKTAGPEEWLSNFAVLVRSIKYHGMKPVFIFDGPSPPIEKREEQDRRRAEAAKKKEKIGYMKKFLARLESKEKGGATELDDDEMTTAKEIISKKNLSKVNFYDILDVITALKEQVKRQERQNEPILPIYSEKAKELINILGFCYFQADGEAEALCAGMCYTGLVDLVLTEDTDVLAIGAPFMLSKLDLSSQKATLVSHSAILTELGWTAEQFRDLCIMLGCDYNDRVQGFPPDGKKRKKPVGIGAKGAFCMIKEYGCLEEVEKHLVDASPLIYPRCREIFTPPEELPHTIPYNKPIDEDRLKKFIAMNNMKVNLKFILESWKPPTIIISGEVEDD